MDTIRAHTHRRVAVVHGAPLGIGGLGVQCANAIAGAIASGAEVLALGPRGTVFENDGSGRLSAMAAPEFVPAWLRRFTWLRWNSGRFQQIHDRALGEWAAAQLRSVPVGLCYAFTQVGLESMRWARESGIKSILDSPNGHIRNFRDVYVSEARRWCGGSYRGHPTPAMVSRVEEEYRLADRIRVSSRWSRDSLVRGGVASEKIDVLEQAVDLARFRLPAARPIAQGPLRVAFVGSLDLRKGFAYLLEGIRKLGSKWVEFDIVGATGTRCCRQLFQRLSQGLAVRFAPGDPVPVLHRAELFALPSLEDGSPFAVAEAMACGLPVVVARTSGAAEWVRPGASGWVVAERSGDAIAVALEEALRRRHELSAMGALARRDTEQRAGPAACAAAVGGWLAAQMPTIVR